MPDKLVPPVIPADAEPALLPLLAVDAPEPVPPVAQPQASETATAEPALQPSDVVTDLSDAAVSTSPNGVPAVAATDAATEKAQDESVDNAAGASADASASAPDAAADGGTPPVQAREMSPAACAELLKQHFPALFAGPAKPIKLRVHVDIQQRAPGVFSKGALSAFFRRYTGSTGYLIALGKASQRFDLDGLPAGELSEEHRQLARDELTRRRQITRGRDQQARPAAEPGQAPVRTPGEPDAATPGEPSQPRARRQAAPGQARRDGGPARDGGQGERAEPRDRPQNRPRNASGRPSSGPSSGASARPAARDPGRSEPAQRLASPPSESLPHPTEGVQGRTSGPFEPVAKTAAPVQVQTPAKAVESTEALLARQARSTLLRDFSRTPLTLANFCALKGLSLDAVTPLLEQARKEAADSPAPQPMDDREGARRDSPSRDPRTAPRRDGRDSRDSRDGREANAGRAQRPAGAPGERPRNGPPGRPPGRPNSR